MKLLAAPTTESYASAASLWEIAIKTHLGKLDPGMALEDLAGFLEGLGLTILPIDKRHAVALAQPEPQTRDPFDGILLAQCEVEGLRLATIDRALAAHPLAVRFEQ
jgi:PIN domain nuclease of toxin-antitoxin system